MRSFLTSVAAIAAFLASAKALTITSPTGGTIDPTKPITVTWTSTSSDPATFDLILDNPESGLTSNEKVATGISTASGSYSLTSNALYNFGAGFVLKAQDSVGTVLATSPPFSLAQGGYIETTGSDGQTSLIPTSNGAQTSGPAAQTTGADSATMTGTDASASPTMMSSNTLRTSTTATSRSSGSSTSSAHPSASANSQPRLMGGSEIVLSAAGVLAGFVALLA